MNKVIIVREMCVGPSALWVSCYHIPSTYKNHSRLFSRKQTNKTTPKILKANCLENNTCGKYGP